MNRETLNDLSEKITQLQTACLAKFSLDTEIETIFRQVLTEIETSQNHGECQQDLFLYVELLRYFDKINSCLNSQFPRSLSSEELINLSNRPLYNTIRLKL
ncbi:hypothetical protein [Aphanothece sacrum]|uniref:Aspartate kinase n=1 Tax=Aphanothece sacrum FPU1 TaxID=1920663 RepID=A0A401ILA5_APHSA|nr:hypothetical protein [Aphanothece sacrum]GBF82021.1 aspartate kinase [Aphanothece sacrum FPU1]GBF85838.1 aspartate kinase [Aphanothece sacrum FPU3]